MILDVIICTHNPRRDVFGRVLAALGAQTLARERFGLWVIDNASSPPIGEEELAPLKEAGIGCRLEREPRCGNVYARRKGIECTRSQWVVFVDDDNVLAPDYLERVVEIAESEPKLGCFGGKLVLPKCLQPPKWTGPILPYLAIRDYGEKTISNCANEWGRWEPATAGAAVRRPLLELYCRRLSQFPQLLRLGRKGRHGFFSCEDSLMMRGAFPLGLLSAYYPQLVVEHHLAPGRFRFAYLARLMHGLGRSHVILERALGRPVPVPPRRQGWRLCRKLTLDRAKLCRRAYDWGYFLESRAQGHNSHLAEWTFH